MSQENKIEVINREGWRKDYPVQKGIVYIGSGPTNDIVLETLHGGGVAPLHAQLIANRSGYKLINLSDVDIVMGSSLGEIVVKPRTAADLMDGQSFRLGDFTLIFRGTTETRYAGLTTANGREGQSVGASLLTPETQLEPYQSLQGRVIVSNLGPATARFVVTLEGLEEVCYDIAPGPLLSSGAEDGVLFRVHHRGVKPAAGEWNIVFRVTAPKAYPGEKVVLSQRIQVLPLYRHRLTLLPSGSVLPPSPPEDLLTPKAVDIPLSQANNANTRGDVSSPEDDVWSASGENEVIKALPPPSPIRLEARPTRPVRIRPEAQPVAPKPPAAAETDAESEAEWGWEAKDEADLVVPTTPIVVGEDSGDWGLEDEGEAATVPVEPAAMLPEDTATQQKKRAMRDISTAELGVTPPEEEMIPPPPPSEPNDSPDPAPVDAVVTDLSEPRVDETALPSAVSAGEILSSSEMSLALPASSSELAAEPEVAVEVPKAESKPPDSDETAGKDFDEETAVQSASSPRWWQRWRQWLPFRQRAATDPAATEPIVIEETASFQEEVVEVEAIPVSPPKSPTDPLIQAETMATSEAPPQSATLLEETGPLETEILLPEPELSVEPVNQTEPSEMIPAPAEISQMKGAISPEPEPSSEIEVEIEPVPASPEIASTSEENDVTEEALSDQTPADGTAEMDALGQPDEERASTDEADTDEWWATEFEAESPSEIAPVLKVKAEAATDGDDTPASETDEVAAETVADWWDFEADTPIEKEQEIIKIKAQAPADPLGPKKEVPETEDWWSAD